MLAAETMEGKFGAASLGQPAVIIATDMLAVQQDAIKEMKDLIV
jgi:hypothetical protein